jgi:hypothetical protein
VVAFLDTKGIVLHTGILVTLDVGPFSWVTMAYYMCCGTPTSSRTAARLRRKPSQP